MAAVGEAHVEPETLRMRLMVPVLVSIGMAVAMISSLGSPMVPTAAAEYGVSLGAAQWTLTIALLAGAICTPVMGRLGDGPHRRQVILSVLGLITLGSLLAGIPSSFALLLVGRALQGIGLGLMPVAMAVARDHLPRERATQTVAILSISAAAGVGIGYPLSGLCADTLGYHATFVLAAAICAVILAAAIWTIPESRQRVSHRLDVVGALLLALGLATIVLALSQASAWGMTSWRFLGVLAIAPVSLGFWVVHELRTTGPLINLRMLKNTSVRVAQIGAVLTGIGIYLLLSSIVRYVQTPTSTGYGLGQSVLVAGLVLVPFSIASLSANRLLVIVRRHVSAVWIMPGGCLAFIAAMIFFAVARTELWELFVVMALAGIGVGAVYASMPILIVSGVPVHETGSALGFNQVLRTVGSSIGSAATGAILTAHTLAGSEFPEDGGYTTVAIVGVGVWIITMIVAFPRRGLLAAATENERLSILEAESVDAEAAGVMMYDIDTGDAPFDDPDAARAAHQEQER